MSDNGHTGPAQALSGKRIGFRTQLAVAFTAGIVVLALASSLVTSQLSTRTVRDTLVAQGRRVTATLANQSRLAVLYASGANAEEAALGTLDFPDVRGVSVYSADGTELLHRGSPTVPEIDYRERTNRVALVAETDSAWYFVAPVVTGSDSRDDEFPFYSPVREPDQLGYVRLVMGKDTLKSTAADILQGNVGVALALAMLLLLVLLAITRRMTDPLGKLATIMGRAQAGDTHVRAELAGPRDIVRMESAFNTMMDVLEVREAELKRARDTALESARVKGEFAANVSHELRTPMNSILGMLELLEGLELSPQQREYVGVARSSSESLLRLIDDILDFSRTESGRLELQPVDFYPHDTLDDVVRMLSNQALRKEIRLDYRIDPAVPTAIRGDGDRVRQILINLVANAIKFTDEGSVSIDLRASRRAGTRLQLEFSVIDTGIGIAPEMHERVFEAFTQQDGSTSRRYGGTGLGLTICRQLVGLMGGEIGVDSEPERGSRFWFHIPVTESSLTSGDGGRSLLAGLRVLLAIDDSGERETLEHALREWGLQVTCTNCPTDVERLLLDAGTADPFEIAIIDEDFRGSNGEGLAVRVVREPALRELKVITVGSGTSAQAPDPGDLAADLRRPVDTGALYAAVLGARRQTRREIAPGMGIEEPAASGYARPTAHVLVVEDNTANQRVAAAMLERLGCTCEIVASGEAAVAAAAATDFDAVLMDCNMPVVDGFEATRRIRAAEGAGPRVPIVALTATVREGIWSRCLAAGMDDYLAKPIKVATLRGKLEYWLGGRLGDPGAMAAAAPEAATGPDDGTLDRGTFEEMQSHLGDAFAGIIDSFLADMPLYIGAIRTALDHGDSRTMSEQAHTLRGSSQNVGGERLATLCKQIEDAGRMGRFDEARELATQLDAAADRLRHRLRNTLSGPAVQRPAPTEDAQHVLVVDDDRTLRNALRQALERDGHVVEEAADGSQALALCRRQLPDLVLMDGRMPNMDGFTACMHIRRLPGAEALPILIVTALEEQEFIERAFEAGATDYIAKPVHFGVLRQRVGGLLGARRAERDVRQLAYQDALTGLPNRTYFMERLGAILADPRTAEGRSAILFLDLDRFKLVNDTMGHEVGDLLLKAAAERIVGCIRSDDLLARLGGDEFALIMTHLPSGDIASSVARKICRVIARPFTFHGHEVHVATSIGISLYPDDGDDIGTLMKHADTAMFRAKERGDGYRFYEQGMEAIVTRRMELENDLRLALERDQFDVVYQPRVALDSGRVVGMEALLRWNHPVRGSVSPADFIPLAEANGTIHEIGLWILERACRQSRAWLQEGFPPLKVSVNVSGRQFEHPNLPDRVGQVLERTGLAPHLLELEITESAIMQRPDDASRLLGQLRDMGISIALDDFGTGYSSLAYLQRFPLDSVKLDRTFVADAGHYDNDRVLVGGIVGLAHALKLRVVAEGVEDEHQLEAVRLQGCDEVQGFLIARPLSPAAFEEQMLRRPGRVLATGGDRKGRSD